MSVSNAKGCKAYARRRVLVTGATGFIGRWVARALSTSGAELFLVTRSGSGRATLADEDEIRGRWLQADLSCPGTFADLYRDARPEVTFNLAGYGVDPAEQDELEAHRLNADLVREIAESVLAQDSDWPGLRVVHVGTAAEYGPVREPITEDSLAAPIGLYGRTKLGGTLALASMIKRAGLRATTARVFTVYGPGEHAGRLLPSLLAAARSGEALPLTHGLQRRDFTWVGDVGEGLLRLGITPEVPAVVNLATGKLTTVREFVACAAKLLPLTSTQLHFGELHDRPNELHQGPVDTSRLQRLLGWVPSCSIIEGIRQTIEFEFRLSRAGS